MKPADRSNVLLIIVLNLVIVPAELFYGVLANSIALITDAFHNLGDVLAIVVTYVALVMSTKKPTFNYTFGFLKSEMMAAFVNSLFLVATLGFLIFESTVRLINPQEVRAEYMIVVALIALAANGVSAYLLSRMGMGHHHHHHHDHEHDHAHGHHHHHHEDLNIRSAYLHMLGDALVSLGVVIGGVIIYYFGIAMIDSVLAIVFSLYILKETVPVLKKSFLSLLEANISNIDEQELSQVLLSSEHVKSFHDLHLTQPKSGEVFLSVHLVMSDGVTLAEVDEILQRMRAAFKELGITHTVIQAETAAYEVDHPYCVNH